MEAPNKIYLDAYCKQCGGDDPGWTDCDEWGEFPCDGCGRNIKPSVYHKEQEGKTLIGTCGDCRLWEEIKGDEFGNCLECDRIETSELTTRKHFGCIHWEGKK